MKKIILIMTAIFFIHNFSFAGDSVRVSQPYVKTAGRLLDKSANLDIGAVTVGVVGAGLIIALPPLIIPIALASGTVSLYCIISSISNKKKASRALMGTP